MSDSAIARREKNDREEPRSNGKHKFNRNQNRNHEKFKPNFKKKVPTWKQIDQEIADLLPKYEQVKLKLHKFGLILYNKFGFFRLTRLT